MDEYKPIPVAEAQSIAERFDKSVVIIAAWDPVFGLLHMTTYGVDEQEKHWAALGGEKVADVLGATPDLEVCFEDFRRANKNDRS